MKNAKKGGVSLPIYAIMALGLVALFFFITVAGAYVPGKLIETSKKTEQANTELYSLLEQDFCGSGVTFREVLASGIVQGISDPAQSIPFVKADGSQVNVAPKDCVEQYMQFLGTANQDAVFHPNTCGTYMSGNKFLTRVCSNTVNYNFQLFAGSCTGSNGLCFSLQQDNSIKICDIDARREAEYIALPDGTTARAVLELKRCMA